MRHVSNALTLRVYLPAMNVYIVCEKLRSHEPLVHMLARNAEYFSCSFNM